MPGGGRTSIGGRTGVTLAKGFPAAGAYVEANGFAGADSCGHCQLLLAFGMLKLLDCCHGSFMSNGSVDEDALLATMNVE